MEKKKPNRTKKRSFSACDAARVARQALFDDPELTPEIVLACIAKGLKFQYISLSRIEVVESGIGLGKVDPRLAALGLSKLIILIEKGSPFLKKYLLPLLPALKKALDYLNKIDVAEPPQAPVDEVIPKGKCECKYSDGEDLLNGYKNDTGAPKKGTGSPDKN